MKTPPIAAVIGVTLWLFSFPLHGQGPGGGSGGPGGGGGPGGSSGGPSRSMWGGMGSDNSVAMTVADGAIFLLTQGKVYKFDDKSLKQLAVASLATSTAGSKSPPSPPTEGSSGPGSGGPGSGGPGGGGMGPDGSSPGGMPGMMARMRSGGVAIQVANNSVYVFYQSKLYRLDESDLQIQATASIESSPERRPPPPSGT